MPKIDYTKIYQKQIVEMATESKETLTVRKEIIIDVDITDSQLGGIIRQMYKAKCEAADEHIKHINQINENGLKG
jgi:DNA primase catalytic subunit